MKRISTILSIIFTILIITSIAACSSKVDEYTIRFETNGGSAIETIKQKAGVEVLAPNSPTQVGYSFLKWTKNSLTGELFQFPITMPKENLVLWANWSANTYTISFESRASNISIPPIIAEFGSDISEPILPSREIFKFSFWSTSINGDIVQFPEKMPNYNLTLYANWVIKDKVIGFNTNYGTVIKPLIQEPGSAIASIENPIRHGYDFIGWFKDDMPYIIPATMPNEDIILEAKWTPNSDNEDIFEDGIDYQFFINQLRVQYSRSMFYENYIKSTKISFVKSFNKLNYTIHFETNGRKVNPPNDSQMLSTYSNFFNDPATIFESVEITNIERNFEIELEDDIIGNKFNKQLIIEKLNLDLYNKKENITIDNNSSGTLSIVSHHTIWSEQELIESISTINEYDNVRDLVNNAEDNETISINFLSVTYKTANNTSYFLSDEYGSIYLFNYTSQNLDVGDMVHINSAQYAIYFGQPEILGANANIELYYPQMESEYYFPEAREKDLADLINASEDFDISYFGQYIQSEGYLYFATTNGYLNLNEPGAAKPRIAIMDPGIRINEEDWDKKVKLNFFILTYHTTARVWQVHVDSYTVIE